jgi:phage baseplate assembly protein W
MTLDAARIFGKGISFPPRVGPDGRVCWSAGESNVRESIRVILMTETRERVALPDFGGGLGQFLFEPNTVATRQSVQERIQAAITRWEPRVRVENVDVQGDAAEPSAATATITYRLVATQARERVSVRVTLGS